jgi:hypothetical protein
MTAWPSLANASIVIASYKVKAPCAVLGARSFRQMERIDEVKRKNYFLLLFFVLLLASFACKLSQPTVTSPTPHPLVMTLPSDAVVPGTVPLSEAGVPRITVEDAKAAVDAGEAIIVDVRSPDAYEFEHVEGAINIPLGYFETDIANIPLEKDQWIITYCT